MTWKDVASWVVRLALLGGCVGYALWDIDFAQLGAAIASYDPWRVVGLTVLTFGAYFALAFRLVALLRGVAGEPRVNTTLFASIFALGMNNLLPARLGEVAKVVYLRQRCEASTGWLMGAVFWERFADVHAVAALCALTLVSFGQWSTFLPMVAMVAGGWIALILLRAHPARFRALAERVPGAQLRRFGRDIIDYLERRMPTRIAVALTVWTIVTWILWYLHVYLALVWVAELDLSATQVMAVFLGVSLGMVVPISPGALGVYEAIVILVLGWYGIGPETALAAALTAHMAQYLPTTLVAAAILFRTDVSIRGLTSPRGPTANDPQGSENTRSNNA